MCNQLSDLDDHEMLNNENRLPTLSNSLTVFWGFTTTFAGGHKQFRRLHQEYPLNSL